MELTHTDSQGKAYMVDVSQKETVKRIARAYGKIILQSKTIKLLKDNLLKKGDVLSVAKIAGIMASKKTDGLIPLCHGLSLEHSDIEFQVVEDGVEINSSVITSGKTGVEMEALTAVSVAALTIYDMCKAVDKEMRIENIHLTEKRKLKEFKIISINTSKKKGEKKKPVSEAELKENYGIIGDAHAKDWHRQVSLLAHEDFKKITEKGLDVSYGDFAENITTQGINLAELPIGKRIYLGDVILEVTQIGKECHDRCEIFKQVGDCIMPKRGIFAKIIKGGKINNESSCYYDI